MSQGLNSLHAKSSVLVASDGIGRNASMINDKDLELILDKLHYQHTFNTLPSGFQLNAYLTNPDTRIFHINITLAFQWNHTALQGDLRAACQYEKGGCKKEGNRLLSGVCCDRTRGTGFK